MPFHKTHTVSKSGVIWDLYQDIATPPVDINQLPVLDTGEEVYFSFDDDGISPMSTTYRLEVLNNAPDDLYSVFNGALPNSIMLEITLDAYSVFKGFFDPKYIDTYLDSEKNGGVDVITADFFSGMTSLKNTNISPGILESFSNLSGVDQNTLISYDRFFQGISLRSELRGTKVTYAWEWGCEVWRIDATVPITWNMFVDMVYKYDMYHAFDYDEGVFSAPGDTFGSIFSDICRSFFVRIGWSFLQESFCVFDVLSGFDGDGFDANVVESETPGVFGGFPRISNLDDVFISQQTATIDDVVQPPRAIESSLAPYSSVSTNAPTWRFFDPAYGNLFTVDSTIEGFLFNKGYSYATKFVGDSDTLIYPDPVQPVRVIYSDVGNTFTTSLSYISYDPLFVGVFTPSHALIAFLNIGWRGFKRLRRKLRFKKIIDPMIPLRFDGKTWIVTKASIDLKIRHTEVELLEMTWESE